MIVYAGKQFWNDFNNGDEWVFQDANRPRDNDKFKLQPWLQSWKWDWRWTNKNTDFSHVFIKGFSQVPWTSANTTLKRTPLKLQSKWTESEISSIPEWTRWDLYAWQIEKQNNPFVIIKEWTLTYSTWDGSTWYTTGTINTEYYEIAESWLYYIMAYGKFAFDTSYYDSNYGYQYKEWVWIAQPINWVFTNTDRTQSRAVGNGDLVRFMQISWYPQWSQIIPIAAHSLTNWTNYVEWGISLVRLW